MPELFLALDGMTLTVPFGGEVVVHRFGKNSDLLSDKSEQRRRRALAGAQSAARIAQIAKRERVAETVVIPAAAQNRRNVSRGQREVPNQLALVGGGIEQLRDLRFAQSLPSRHSCLLKRASGRPSDPGQGVDERAALDAERPADGGF
jgi:hypothetical protein